MAEDNVDMRFLGRQVQILQRDVRDLRVRLDTEVAGVRGAIVQMQADYEDRMDRVDTRLDRVEARLDRIEGRMDHVEARLTSVENGLAGVNARLDQVIETSATNLQILLAAIGKRDG